MSTVYSLSKIIRLVLEEKKCDYGYESEEKNLRRHFNKLVERLGTNVDALKKDGKTMIFSEAEVPFMKILLSQFYDKKGIIYEFTTDKSTNKKFSPEEVHNLIQQLLDEADKSGMDEEELKQMAIFLSRLFSESPLRSIEYCHRLIDCLALSLGDLTATQQAVCFKHIEDILLKEFKLRIAESAINIKEIADIIEYSKEYFEDEIGVQNYEEYEPEIVYEYMQRDRQILDAIQNDDNLRRYIEDTFNKKAEDIFNLAAKEK